MTGCRNIRALLQDLFYQENSESQGKPGVNPIYRNAAYKVLWQVRKLNVQHFFNLSSYLTETSLNLHRN
jgi:hypothetical protein